MANTGGALVNCPVGEKFTSRDHRNQELIYQAEGEKR
jgi:hypothetical protein